MRGAHSIVALLLTVVLIAPGLGCRRENVKFGAPCTTSCEEPFICFSGICVLPADIADAGSAGEGEGEGAEGEGAGVGEGEGEGEGGEGEGEGALGNHPPFALADLVVVHNAADTTQPAVTIDLAALDDDAGDTLTFSLVSQNTDAVITVSPDGHFGVATPSASTGGSFVFRASDGIASSEATVNIVTLVEAAEADEWTGAVDDNWDNGANWKSGVVPQSVSRPFIPVAVPRFPRHAGSDLLLQGLLVETGASLALGGATLTISIGDGTAFALIGGEVQSTNPGAGVVVTDGFVAGRFPALSLPGGSISTAGGIRADALTTGGPLSLNHDLYIAGALNTVNSGAVVAVDRNIEVDGDVALAGAGMVLDGGRFRARRDFTIFSGGLTSENGNLFVFDGGAREVSANATFDTMDVGADGAITLRAPLTVNHVATVKGKLTIPAGQVLTSTAELDVLAGGIIDGAGAVFIESGATNAGRYAVETTDLGGPSMSWPPIAFTDVIVGGGVALVADAAVSGAVSVPNRLSLGRFALTAASLSVTGSLDANDNDSAVIVTGDVLLASNNSAVTLAQGRIQTEGLASVVTLAGPPSSWGTDTFTFVVNNGHTTFVIDLPGSCDPTNGFIGCRVSNISVASAASATLPTRLKVDGTLQVDGALSVLDGNGYVVANALVLGPLSDLATGGCVVEHDPGFSADSTVGCHVYFVTTCSDTATVSRCP